MALHKPLLAAAVLAASLVAACGGGGGDAGTPVAAQFTAVDLPAGFVAGTASAVSNDGLAVAGSVWGAQGRQLSTAYTWRSGQGVTLLGTLPGGTYSWANAISGDGTFVAGTADTQAGTRGFRWSAGEGMRAIDPLELSEGCSAGAMSRDGGTIAGNCLRAGNLAYRWTAAAGTLGLGRFGTGTSGGSVAMAVSRDGSVIAGAGQANLTGAMVWNGMTPVVLGRLNPSDRSTVATALSANGLVATGTSVDENGFGWMFLWTAAGGMQRVQAQPPGTTAVWPIAMSGDGRIVVGRMEGAAETAFLWDAARGVRDLAAVLADDYGLTVPGWTLQRANAISEDGRVIAGTGLDPQGASRGWIVRLAP